MVAQKQYQERLEKEKLQQAAAKSALPKPKLPDPVITNTIISTIEPEIQQPVQSAPKLINRPQESTSGIPQTPPYSGGKISGSFPVKNFAETMEDLHHRKQQEEMGQVWFSPLSSTNKTDRHDITEILLKVPLNTITPPIPQILYTVQSGSQCHKSL
jgi:hypothetical protein